MFRRPREPALFVDDWGLFGGPTLSHEDPTTHDFWYPLYWTFKPECQTLMLIVYHTTLCYSIFYHIVICHVILQRSLSLCGALGPYPTQPMMKLPAKVLRARPGSRLPRSSRPGATSWSCSLVEPGLPKALQYAMILVMGTPKKGPLLVGNLLI